MYAFADNQRNKITLSQLMAFYRGRKIIFDNIEKKLLPNQLQTALFGEFKKTNESNVRKGIAYERFKACANVFEDKYAEEILENWNNEWQNLISHSQDGDTKTAIPPRKCAERIINGEREILKKICPELLRWLDNALNLNSDDYLKKVFSVLTILAITRDKTGEHWTAFAEKLLNDIPDFLPIINVLSDEPSTEAQKALEECKRLHAQGDLEQAKKIRNTAFEENKPLWNSNVWREWANLQPEDAVNSYRKARAFLEDALKEADKEELRKQWREISDEFLKETIKRLKLGDETFLEDFKNNPSKEEFYRHWYGMAFFRLANKFLSRP